MVGRTIGRYRVVSKIGEGGYASVWKAFDALLGRSVALKILDERLAASPSARRRFQHEAQAAAALDHPGIVAVYDSAESDGQVYIALSLIEGETLSERAARRLLAFDDAVRIVCAAAEALGHAHQRGVLHRDVTGRNIMIARDGRVIMLDFGLALVAWESRVTSTETTMGTAAYMAPEVMRGGEADARSDLYGLGVVLYEALTGSFPFVGEVPQAVFYAAMNLDPVPVRERRPEILPALESVVMRAIAREPGDRYPNAGDLIAALRQVTLQESGPGAIRDESSSGAAASESRAAPLPLLPGEGGRGAAPTYLAVLPFEVVASTPDPDGAASTLASRLAEIVGSALAGSPGLRVVPPSTVPLPDDPRDAARELGANLLLRGSVRRAGSQVRVDFSLLDPWRDAQLGGGVVDGSALQIFEVEDRVVASVSQALGVPPRHDRIGPKRPSDPAAQDRYLQALGYLKRYDAEASVDGAIRLLERLIVSEGEVAIYYAALARAFLHKYEHTKQHIWEGRAAKACEHAMELDPSKPEVHLALGGLHISTGRYGEAIEEYQAALRDDPECFDALLGMARAHRGAGHLPEAERHCGRAIALRPDDWRGHLMLGWVHYRAGDNAKALGPWSRVLELTPDNALGRRYLGTAYYRLDRFDDAIAAYRESLAIQPNDEAYSNLGSTLYFLGRYEESLSALRQAVQLTPTDPWRWGNLGNACHFVPGHAAEGDAAHDHAIGLMSENLERNPHEARWWALLAGWLASRGRREEASSAIRRAVGISPDDVLCMVRAGHVYFLLEDRVTCLHWLQEARRAGYGAGELRRSREFAPLFEDPRFVALLEEPPSGVGPNGGPEHDGPP